MKKLFSILLLLALYILSPSVQKVNAQPYKSPQTFEYYTGGGNSVQKGHDWELVQNNPELVLGDYRPYPVRDDDPKSIPALTKAPKGYKPFYISHYGRHGSRWLIQTNYYKSPVAFLKKAKSDGQLTELGNSLLDRLIITEKEATSRYGELTKLGAKQHREIAGRMFKNFPEVFKGNVEVDARSTVIIRCILSMEAFCQRLKELNPKLQISNDASYFDMAYMNYQDPDKYFASFNSDKQRRSKITDFAKQVMKPERFVASILKDPAYFDEYNKNADSIENFVAYNANAFMRDISQQVIDLPNTDLNIDLTDVMTLEELYQVYVYRNMSSYFYAGWDNLSDNVMPYRQTNLLRNIISTADEHIADGKEAVTLRFGHDSNVLPLCSLMNIDGAGVHIDDPNDIADNWTMHYYIPKAANLQFIFYRSSKDKKAPILVKVLLNEREATLPVPTDKFPYYEWEQFKSFYNDILKDSPANNLNLR